MLMLGRKPGESILINDDIEITISQVRGNTVKVGIQATDKYRIVRKEIASQYNLSKPFR